MPSGSILLVQGKTLGVEFPPSVVDNLRGYHLSPFGKANAEAAGILYRKGEIQEIWLLMGKTSLYSESAEMSRYLHERFSEIPEHAILVLESATNTVEELKSAVGLMRSRGIPSENVSILSAGFQLERSNQILQRLLKKGSLPPIVESQYVAAEDIVPQGFFSEHDEEIRRKEEKKERTGRFLLRIDPDWHFFGFTFKLLRKIGIS